MIKNKLIGIVALGSLLSTIGLLSIFNSAKLGLTRAENWLIEQGGETIPHTYL